MGMSRSAFVTLTASILALTAPSSGLATDITGTVAFQGNVTGYAATAVLPEDMTVKAHANPQQQLEATGNGVKCTLLSKTTDSADALGAYPSTGAVTAEIFMERGGGNLPTGDCVLTLTAGGTDGVSESARGSVTVFVNVTDLQSAATFDVNIEVAASKAIAGVDKDCRKWVKKTLLSRSKCNALLLKKGPEKADRCKDAGFDRPVGCDDGDSVGAILALSHGSTDQQLDPPNAVAPDLDLTREQVNCQKRYGKGAANYTKKRVKLVDKKCVQELVDDEECRAAQGNTAKRALTAQVDKCTVDQVLDSGLLIPDITAPCDACIDAGVIDRKCMKPCLQLAIDQLSDGIIGDVPECGNGITQAPEECDGGIGCGPDCLLLPPR